MKIILLLLLIFQTTFAIAAKSYIGTGEANIANTTPELARIKAREQAFLDILQQVVGIDISSQQLVVNAKMASYHILQTHRARVINSHCEYQITQSQGQLTQVAHCSGGVQEFGNQGPDIRGALVPIGDKDYCDFSTSEFNAVNDIGSLFKSKQRFCLLLSSHENVYVGVFAMYHHGEKVKISRVFPEDDKAALIIKAGEIPRLTPLSSQTLSGQKMTHEAFFILASREPFLGHLLLSNSAGFSVEQTVENSVDMAQFDQGLGRLNLDRINIIVLPFAVTR